MSNGSESPNERSKEAVRQAYGEIAQRFNQGATGGNCCPTEATAARQGRRSCCDAAQQAATGPVTCCDSATTSLEGCGAAARYYSLQALQGLPSSVTAASLGCGNPLAIASLQPDDIVLDLGAGGGIDCFLAARQIGPEGRVIGLDMTPDMVTLARHNAKKIGVTNVEFRYGEMEEIPLPDETVDVIISNCVINLSPDKDAVFGEAFRVLRPGGRLSISDVVTDGDLPPAIRHRLDAWAGCIAGALDERMYLDKIRAAGFVDVRVVDRTAACADQVAGEEVQAPLAARHDGASAGQEAPLLLPEANVSIQELARMVVSIKVQARKPL